MSYSTRALQFGQLDQRQSEGQARIPSRVSLSSGRGRTDPALIASAAQPSAGIVSSWGSSRPHLVDSCLDPYGPAWHLDRVAFERLLRDQAIASGARILPDTRVVHTRRSAAGTWTVTTRGGEETSRRAALRQGHGTSPSPS